MSEDRNVTSLFRKRKQQPVTKHTIGLGEGLIVTPDMLIPMVYIQRFHNGYVFLDKFADDQIIGDICAEPIDGWFWSALKTYIPSEFAFYCEETDSKAFEEAVSVSEWRFVYKVADRKLFGAHLEMAAALSERDYDDIDYKYAGYSAPCYLSAWRHGDAPPHEFVENVKHRQAVNEQARLKSQSANSERRKSKPLLITTTKLQEARADTSTSFAYWNSMLHGALNYYDEGENDLEYIRLLGRRCIELLEGGVAESEAYLAARIKRDLEMGYAAEYENQRRMEYARIENNKVLPKYINYLKNVGLIKEAIWACEELIIHGVSDGTQEGFERRKSKLMKLLAR